MVLEIIREKDQADFRGVRGDFGSRLGGGSIEVGSAPAPTPFRTWAKFSDCDCSIELWG